LFVLPFFFFLVFFYDFHSYPSLIGSNCSFTTNRRAGNACSRWVLFITHSMRSRVSLFYAHLTFFLLKISYDYKWWRRMLWSLRLWYVACIYMAKYCVFPTDHVKFFDL
jgi:hypothetical protein